MNAITFDTHKFIKQLQAKGVSEEHAEAIVDTVVGIQQATSQTFATKSEATQFKSELSSDIKLLEKSFKTDIEALENKLLHKIKDEIAPLKTNITLLTWMMGLIIITLVVPAIKQLLNL